MTSVSFDFTTAGRITTGPGRAAELPGVLAGLGSRVLVGTGADAERHADLAPGVRVFPVGGGSVIAVGTPRRSGR